MVRPRVLIKTLVTAYKTDDSLPSKLLQVTEPVAWQPPHDQGAARTSTLQDTGA